MRAVIDTNVLVSGLIWRGPPHAVLERVRTGSISFVSSPALLAELSEVLARDKFRTHLLAANIDFDQAISDIGLLAEIINPAPLITPVSRDRDDDIVLAVAVSGRADLIISGDRDLLVLENYLGIDILTPAQAISQLDAGG